MKKPYWHELSIEDKRKAGSRSMFFDYVQPSWCTHPEALAGIVGCWGLTLDPWPASKEYCKTCEFNRKTME